MKLIELAAAGYFLLYASAFAQSESEPAPATVAQREGTVFGLLLGKDTSQDVASRVQLFKRSGSNSLRDKNEFVWIKRGDIDTADAGVFFAEFRVDGESLLGSFYNNTLIAVAVTNDDRKKSDRSLDRDVDIKLLMASFNQKYRKMSAAVKTSTDHGVNNKYTYHMWKDKADRFEVHLTRHEFILVNKVACLAWLRDFNPAFIYYSTFRRECEGSFDEYDLEYRALRLYRQAFDQSRQLEAKEKADVEAQQKKDASDRVNRY